ncbi:hypothetical protein M5689_020546 [Euphorbia peplus]|nr:hypothetical protein M5689_020546 [Euphorbia peplus]
MSRLMTMKASNRSAVHGTKQPLPQSIQNEEAEKEMEQRKQDKQNKMEEMEKTVDSNIKDNLSQHDHVIKP